MTEPDDKMKQLLEAAQAHVSNAPRTQGHLSTYAALLEALAAFEPEPEMVYGPMPAWSEQAPDIGGNTEWMHKSEYEAIRNSTRKQKKAPARS